MESGPTGPSPGAWLGRYQIQREIGRGGMGAIYLARDTTLRRPVALKVLVPSATDGRNLRERFVREAQAAAKIRHRNVVAVHDVHDGETPFIVLEFLEGETLDALFKREGRLGFARALDLLLPVMSAVRAAHEAGVIHRDLKPANIMLARESDGACTPKVLDFGISKLAQVTGLFHAAPADPELTGEGDCIGTPIYMPPEQHGAQQLVGPWSDVYALGLMLYVAVVGKRAFPGRGAEEVLRAKFMGTFVAPSARAAGLPRELDAWMVKALARDVPQRFASVQAMAWALLAFAPPELRARWGPSFAPSEEVLEVSAVEEVLEERATSHHGEDSVDVVFDDEPVARTKLSAVVPIPPAPPARRSGRPAVLSLGAALFVASAVLGWRLAPPRPSPDRHGQPHGAARPPAPKSPDLTVVGPTPVALAASFAPSLPPRVAPALPPSLAPRRPPGAAEPRATRARRLPAGYMMVNGHPVPRPTFEGGQ